MLTRFLKLISDKKGHHPSGTDVAGLSVPPPPPRGVGQTPTVPIYPPVDRGIVVVGVDEVLATQAELLQRLRIAIGMRPEQFEQLFMSPIRNLARHVALLPASEVGTHRGPGGLFG